MAAPGQFRARGATYMGEATSTFESEYVEWVRLDSVPQLIGRKQIVNSTTVAALLLVLSRVEPE